MKQRKYKTPLKDRLRAKHRRDAIKAEGGEAYAELLAKGRASRAEWRKKYPDRYKADHKKHKRTLRSEIARRARVRGRKKGLESTIRNTDIYWPTHCPVLGLELDYSTPQGKRKPGPNSPTLDRWDNTKGYVVGNVYVISMRANTIKSNATADELIAVAKYAAHRPSGALPE